MNPAGKRTPRTQHDVLERIFEYACERGMAALTLGNLSRHLGMSKSGLFARFGSKEGILLGVIDEVHHRFEENVLAPCATKEKLAKAAILVEGYVAFCVRREGRLLQCILLQDGLLQKARTAAEDIDRRFVMQLREALRGSEALADEHLVEAMLFEARGIVCAAARVAVDDPSAAEEAAQRALWRWLSPIARTRPATEGS